ncbi:MBL fold metallo-hydrolase [Alicyclobacillus cycloheptanicus]|uniref:L-ascorbate metabolism protein UlaG (Beta-lactamase superfamily) n=1 Tax=Alicyclobacillus cycloheptanicus TaxID=1457 RepID=A0ABT9XHT6_9BACL|nr:MBL fold metallo-hydrolase [Alicyclobacillus cycloheptanicus]MDQ0189877.1 L-ascorbate metabolism protein UlaG (beta-lactamase superfamily) [Alicyclobacillus cycloheptanicus]WDM02442.1 MBL fold metallo-hydrolase [Alicyclobacillus cycloheptanicus]
MKIRWFGQSSFLLTSEAGVRILIDPFDRMLGYKMPKPIETDIVVVSHNHGDHNKVHVATGDFLLVHEPKDYHRDGVIIQGFKTYHDKVNGKKRGENIVFRISVDDLTLCHCGDLGHLLTEEQAKEIGRVDILMIPVGGRMTLNGEEGAQVMQQLKPTVTIPMHYRTKALSLPGKLLFDKVDKFIEAAGQPTTDVGILDVTPANLSQYAGVVTMQYH